MNNKLGNQSKDSHQQQDIGITNLFDLKIMSLFTILFNLSLLFCFLSISALSYELHSLRNLLNYPHLYIFLHKWLPSRKGGQIFWLRTLNLFRCGNLLFSCFLKDSLYHQYPFWIGNNYMTTSLFSTCLVRGLDKF